MGTKYSSKAVSGYNATPPSDDGTQSAANEIKWSTIKTKLPDPILTLAEAINTALIDQVDESVSDKATNYTTTASDHLKTINATAAVTIDLGDASTMGSGYIVRVRNEHSAAITVGRATGTDTINGTAADITIDTNCSHTFLVNSGTNGFLILDMFYSNAKIKSAYESNSDTNAFTDAEQTKLSNLPGPAAVTNHVRAGNTQILSGVNVSYGAFDVELNLTENTWESVGPTGSSADNIWTAMNDISTDATIVLVDVRVEVSNGSAGIGAGVYIDAAQEGVTTGPDALDNRIFECNALHGADESGDDLFYARLMIPIDSSRRFQMRWIALNEDNLTINLYYRGFMTD